MEYWLSECETLTLPVKKPQQLMLVHDAKNLAERELTRHSEYLDWYTMEAGVLYVCTSHHTVPNPFESCYAGTT